MKSGVALGNRLVTGDKMIGSEIRVRVIRACESCGEDWAFWRYKRARPEYGVCASCARNRWLETQKAKE